MTDQLDIGYIKSRKTSPLVRYRFKRRTKEILGSIKQYATARELSLLDVGAADGAMLKILNAELKLKEAHGIEPLQEFVGINTDTSIKLIAGTGDKLSYQDAYFDVVVMASLVEHTEDIGALFSEAFRVLKKNGVLILSAVDPYIDIIATAVKLKGNTHIRSYTTKELKKIINKQGFYIINSHRYAMPTSGFLPFEGAIENVLRALKLDFMLFYTLMVCKKNA